MSATDSALDAEQMARARRLLERPRRAERMWPVLAAAGFLAVAALTFATAMIMAPPLHTEHAAKGAIE
ncbi:hypothetical protein [Phenylobacterium sp.]|uniref:hypothetical protein n=1 Tax=Phenylobacterium sp. TaxID=1871053 RepID=UPI002B9F8E4F|nr:hypothetical protein [Phenylobacterium sp.]HLZ76207.1 hypothetical protein [Phenylobacterium sp.]